MILLDTNVVSELMLKAPNPRVVAWVDRQPRISLWTTSVTVVELRFGIERLPAGKRQVALMSAFERLLESVLDQRVAPLDHDAAIQTAVLMASRMAKGRPIEQRDGMIAGIAISTNSTIATRNTRHFTDLACQLIDPWDA